MPPSPDDTQRRVHAQFSSVAAHYAQSQVHAQGQDLPAILRLAQLTGQESVLDAGCGPGPVAMTLAPAARTVTAVDFSAAMLDVAQAAAHRRGLRNIQFRRRALEDLAGGGERFDRIVTRYSAHHWPQPERVLRTFRSLIAPDGLVLLCDVMASETPVLDTFLNAIEILRDPSHVRDHAPSQWMRMLTEAGFVPAIAHEWALRLEFEPWIARMETAPARVQALKLLFDGAGADVRAAFKVEADYTFTVPGVVVSARPAPRWRNGTV